MDGDIKLRIEGVNKSFPGVKALDDINLSVKKGSVHVLCGENGAGKSTLMKIINGIYKQDTGNIFIDGEKVEINNPVEAQKKGISMIFQELNFVPEMTVEENFVAGRWPTNKFGKINWKKSRKIAKDLLEQEELNYSIDTKLKDLTISDIQLLEITKAVSHDADIIIMDEPTSAISDKEIEVLFDKINSLRDRGKSVIYISHKMDEIFRIADEITVLRDGQLVSTEEAAKLTEDKVVSLMVGRELSKTFPKENIEIGKEIFSVNNLNRKGVLKDINFKVHRGEIVGFAGLVGAGRTEVMRALFGLDDFDSGEIKIKGKKVKINHTSDSIDNGLVMLSEDRRRFGIIPVRSVRENVTISKLDDFIYGGRLHAKEEKKVVENMKEKLNIKTPSIETNISSLSGGNQQKVILAKWLVNDPDVFLLDEPTRGIDVGAKYEIYKLMTSLANEGKGIVVVSSELPELIGMCDKIYVMSDGEITGKLRREEFSQEAIMKYAIGAN